MLTPDQIEQYQAEGYVIPDFRLEPEVIEDLKAMHARLIERHPEFHDYCPAVLAFDPGFLEIARRPEILDMIEQLIGPDIALWNSSFFAKPALHGSTTPWHQDGEYWPIRPLATCSAWIAIDDSTVDNGCLRFIPGSHRRASLLEHQFNGADGLSLPMELGPEQFDGSTAVDIVLEAGQMSLHDVYLIHGSEPNRSPNPRRGMTLRYMPTASVYRRELANPASLSKGRLSMAERTLYLMRGSDASGENDFRVRF
jgi:ectoine hydroxylase-related dioxygenase (phytanoyl-CoA dioxygenase family)